jgi:hypothetical protein
MDFIYHATNSDFRANSLIGCVALCTIIKYGAMCLAWLLVSATSAWRSPRLYMIRGRGGTGVLTLLSR